MRRDNISVDLLGPPLVMTYCTVKVPKVKIMQDTTDRAMVFLKHGMVIYPN